MARTLFSTFMVASSLLSPSLLSRAQDSNGSDLGTDQAPTYQQFIPDSNSRALAAQSAPWGQKDTVNTNPYTDPPNTGKTRTFDWTVSETNIVVAGKSRPVLLVNNQFPGPTIEANWGDNIVVNVKNSIPDDGTSLHWHGLLQKGTQTMDGIPGVGQCPIAPGSSRTYTFKADLYGTSWWHSHYTAQYSAGLAGPLIIHGPNQVSYDVDKGPVMISDWSYQPYKSLVELAVGKTSGGRVDSDVSLIQGKTNSNFTFQSGQSNRLRLINAAAEASYVFSIDEHNFTVIAHDFVPVKPYTTNSIVLDIGQRADIIVNATGKPTSSYYMRTQARDCTVVTQRTALATIFYEKADKSKKPTSKPWTVDTTCGLEDATNGVPMYAIAPSSSPAKKYQFDIDTHNNRSGNSQWYVNNSTFKANYDQPTLFQAAAGNLTFPAEWNVYDVGNTANSYAQLVLYNHFLTPHPMHMHGHNFQVVAQGYGKWDGTFNVPNVKNPPRRDTYTLPSWKNDDTMPGYLVVQFQLDNPGVWPFHCHIAWHVSGGLYVNLLERAADLKPATIPQNAKDTCTGFMAWQNKGNIVDEIDSGE